MTYPRSHLVSADEPGYYHVVTRCVRRAFLCGKDKVTGQCFEHRRQWIEARILELAERFALAILGNPERVAELRKRLGSLSWFMKALNEPIARRANREDGCKGKFWESRFKCQVLLEPHSVLSCMAYVDLNPARSAMYDTLAESDSTSMQRRLREHDKLSARIKPGWSLLARPLKPVAGLDAEALLARLPLFAPDFRNFGPIQADFWP